MGMAGQAPRVRDLLDRMCQVDRNRVQAAPSRTNHLGVSGQHDRWEGTGAAAAPRQIWTAGARTARTLDARNAPRTVVGTSNDSRSSYRPDPRASGSSA